MGQALYRKYRSRTFDDVIGQEHITETMKSAIKNKRISHAYLLAGPKGVGKTSVARIFARAVNKLDYQDDSVHLDIIEIDAASNRRIDEIRDLRDKVHITPTSAQYKVYIIDEVHMLTREAFNALLKTLEEPPAHCIFILATTEAHKVPETIISRTQRFNFTKISNNQTTKHLAQIAKKENIKIDSEALDILAEHGDGSFRDSIGLLDQLSGSGKLITAELVQTHLGLPSSSTVRSLINSIEQGISPSTIKNIENLWLHGANPVLVAKFLGRVLRLKLIEEDPAPLWLVPTLKQLLEVSSSSNPRDFLEICLLEATAKNVSEKPPKAASSIKAKNEVKAPAIDVLSKKETAPNKPKAKDQIAFDLSMWPQVIGKSKENAASLYTALRLAIPQISPENLTLVFEFPLHKKKISQSKNIDLIASIIEDVTGQKVKIECTVDKEMFEKKMQGKVAHVKSSNVLPELNSVEAINNIFGAAEVLES
ncbi:DNA polymerase III subunit gamma/tau [Candidatus Saccharibacteria bacterium]|nr:DNA polymerase III subunit gamma/tau [Candidatus Saccharibacteria bacterium]